MISKKMNEALNDQLNAEFASAYLYLSMAAHCDHIDLGGFAHWMYSQYQEELAHADKIYAHLNDRDGKVILKPVSGPPTQWDSPLSLFEDALNHEKGVTSQINELTSLAINEADHASNVFLQWFVNEQVEEEKTVRDIIHDLKLVQDSPDGIFMIDRELAQRSAAAPNSD